MPSPEPTPTPTPSPSGPAPQPPSQPPAAPPARPATPPASPPAPGGGVPPAGRPAASALGSPEAGVQAAAPVWATGFDQEDLDLVARKAWETPQDAIRAYRSAEKMLSADPESLLRYPGEGASREELDPILQRLGVPPDPSGYEFGDALAPAEGGQDIRPAYAEIAHEVGLTKEGANRLATWFQEYGQQAVAAQREAIVDAEDQSVGRLMAEWGEAYQAKVQAGNQALATLGLDEEAQWALRASMGPEKFTRTMVEIGEKLGEYRVVEGAATRGSGMTPAEAARKADELMNDEAMFDRTNPRHGELVAKYRELMEKAHGTEPAGNFISV